MQVRSMSWSTGPRCSRFAPGQFRAGNKIAWLTILLGFVVLAGSALAAADGAAPDAMAQVKSAVTKARQLLDDPNFKTAPESRRTELLRLLDSNFDFDGMARSSLGPYWKKLKPNEREHFVSLFHQRLERRYVKIIEDYSGAEIKFLRESPSGPNQTEVYTVVVNPLLAEPLQLNYLLRRTSGAWKVYDLDIAGISEVDSYRKEYVQIIDSQGYDALVKKLANP